MDNLAVKPLAGGDVVFALTLEHLHPTTEFDATEVTREMVALITALEGRTDARTAIQITARPEPKAPEWGTLAVHVLGAVESDGGGPSDQSRARALADDLADLLAAPPLRWAFRAVDSDHELESILAAEGCQHFAEVVRREEPCQPLGAGREMGFRGDVDRVQLDRPLWSMWTLGPASDDLRRLASVLLTQPSPVVLRVGLTPTHLTPEERDGIEQLALALDPRIATDGLTRASLRTIESTLYLRPLFELQCLVASPEPLSRTLLSAIGHSMSEPARHGFTSEVLVGGFSILRDGIETPRGELGRDFHSLRPTSIPASIAPTPLRRLRRLVGAWEAANAFRLPVADDDVFPGLERFELPDLPAPITELAGTGARLGRLVGRYDSPVMMEDEERFRHMYVSGQTGTGKSTLLFNLALQDIERGAGVAVLDPHGDLVEALLAAIPEERANDVVLIDPSDPVAVVGVNLLEAETDLQRQYLVSELCAMFYSMFDPGHVGIVGPRYESMLRAAAGLLLAHPSQPSSLLDIPTVFADTKVREHLLKDLQDPLLNEYWIGEVAQNRSNEFGEVISWFRSKFEVFRMSPLVRNVIGQARSTISFSDVLSSQRILLVNLSKGMLGEYNSALLGQVVFMRLWGAALERAAVPREQRPEFFIYIDEFQNMTTDSLPDVLSEARKFRVGLTLANQFFSQVNERTRDAIMGNVGSRVTFRLGPKDAEPFAYWLGSGVRGADLTTLPNFYGVAALSQHGVPLDSFVMRTDPPRSSGSDDRQQQMRDCSRANWARPTTDLDHEFFSRWAHIRGSFSQQATRPAPTRGEDTHRPDTGSRFLDEWLANRSPADTTGFGSDEDDAEGTED